MKINSNDDKKIDLNEFALRVYNKNKIIELQKEFNAHFPYLKIEFFKTPHKIGEGLPKKIVYNENSLIANCRVLINEGEIFINDDVLVSHFEEEFLNKFGLSVQVFRKSGKVWLETSATDHWSLKAQNNEGAELSK